MTAPVFVTDDNPSADQVNQWMVNIGYARKLSDQAITSSVTLINDSDLNLPVAASTDYQLDMVLDYGSASATPSLQWNLVGPAGATFAGPGHQYQAPASNTLVRTDRITLNVPNVSGTAAGGHFDIHVMGLLRVAATAGTLQLQWAQNVSNGNSVSIFSNSFMRLTRLA